MPDGGAQPAFRFRGGVPVAAALWLLAIVFFAFAAAGIAAAIRSAEAAAALAAPAAAAAAVLLGHFARGLPAAGASVTPVGLAIRFPIALDCTIPWPELQSAVIVRHPWWQGLGIRLDLRGRVALATLPGQAAELTFRTPQPVTVLPFIARARARSLRLTVERPAELVAAIDRYIAPERRP
ncbi:MAG: hypothetical protein KatS3mg062_0528 [Tepidiforma sp.]|nr:MAG: hypothetical protein KatS3mg062_0528 [Tepidiforma sp.]